MTETRQKGRPRRDGATMVVQYLKLDTELRQAIVQFQTSQRLTTTAAATRQLLVFALQSKGLIK